MVLYNGFDSITDVPDLLGKVILVTGGKTTATP